MTASSVSEERGRRRGWAPPAIALLVFVLLAVVHTWPLASNPAHLSRNDNADTLLNTWAIAWVAHQLPRDPVHLFDANIFYPERDTLGYSEAMVVQGVMAMPILAAGGSPVLAYNLVLLAGFAFTGWAFWLLMFRWTGSLPAAYVSGSLAAFNSHALVQLTHLQDLHVEFIALVLFALDALLVSRRVRYALLLGIAFALQGLTSVYLLVFTTWLLIFAAAARAREWLRRENWRAAALLSVAGLTGVALLAPYLLAYAHVHQQGFERSVDDARQFAATWQNYLASGSRLHYALWSRPFTDGPSTSTTFPGVTAILLVALACAWPETRGDRRVRMCLAAAVGCAVVSFLPRAPFYPLLHPYVLLFQAVRVEAHLGQIVLLLMAVLAGFGMVGVLCRIQTPRSRLAVALAAIALVNIEALRAPLDYQPFSSIPHIYDSLADGTHGPIVELPLAFPRTAHDNAIYMLYSTAHWRPMVNGYSGMRPDSYDDLYRRIEGFPDAASFAALKARGITDIVVHIDAYPSAVLERLAHSDAVSLEAEKGNIRIYGLR